MRKKELKNKLIPYLLVLLQFTGLSIIIFTGPFMARGPVLFIIQLLAIGLGIWAVAVMKIGHFNVTPLPQKDASLITKGPYSLIRHPMYSSILIFTLIEVANHYTLFRLLVFLALCITLLWKLHFEERQLVKKFPAYSKYQKNTYKILPFIY